MNINDMIQWIQHPEMLNEDTLQDLEQIVKKYPYFQTARLLYLHNLYMLHSDKFGFELRRSTLYITDRRTIFNMIEGKNYEVKAQQHSHDKVEKKSKDRTLTLIDGYLNEMPKEKNSHVQANIAVDYASYLMQQQSEEGDEDGEENANELRRQDLIDGFINQDEQERKKELNSAPDNANVTKEEKAQESVEENNDENYFTETLAKIYIKQHRYDKALEIIRKLNLKYPQKNIYFADQIRFLEKLIINNKQK